MTLERLIAVILVGAGLAGIYFFDVLFVLLVGLGLLIFAYDLHLGSKVYKTKE